MVILFCFVSLFASTFGAISGVGGGVFIKPVLDALNIYSINIVTFLSSCTVLSMTSYNVLNSVLKNQKESSVDWTLTTWLALGGAIGGIFGKSLYTFIRDLFIDSQLVGGLQAIALFIAIFFTLVYTLNRNKIKSRKITSKTLLTTLGFVLGTLSSFLGIGGGPMNLAVLFYFLSMQTKAATQNSLYIIFVSQIASMLLMILKGEIPNELFIDSQLLVLTIGMMICGVLGGIIGKKLNKSLSSHTVEKLFIFLNILILVLCIYNAINSFSI